MNNRIVLRALFSFQQAQCRPISLEFSFILTGFFRSSKLAAAEILQRANCVEE